MEMKKYITFCLALFILISPLSFCLADDSGEDHICFKRIDSDHDDSVTFIEFEKFYGKDTEKFQKMDQDNDGKLSHDEYEEYLSNQEE
jgi:hypothetical protein